jgi:hypothetical protein
MQAQHRIMNPIQVGIVGAGDISRLVHLPVLKNCADVQIRWIVDLDSRRVRALGRDFDIDSQITLPRKPLARKMAAWLLALLPEWPRRLKAMYSIKAAAVDIAKLFPARELMNAVLRKSVGRTFIDGLAPTIDLLRRPEFYPFARDETATWPADMRFNDD